ncbi:MAG: lytic transglycosylase domain-containing protein [Clostridiales bacterium]|nr:lytic transglycosylase domain-containing protein [Clostridiales bacterium]
MKHRFLNGVVTAAMIAAALAIFYALFCAFLVMARDADEPEQREVVIDLPAEGAPVAEGAEIGIEVGGIEIYREGDGPAPAWYDPTEPMAAEWSANARVCDDQRTSGLQSDYILDVPLNAEFQTYLHGLWEENGVPYTLAVAVIEQESNYNPAAISPTNDWGLMQINEVCHEWLEAELGIDDWLDPYQNAKAGVYILAGYYAKYHYDSGTLVAYNRGQAYAEKLFAAGIYETDYSRRVIGIRWRLEHGGAE